MLIDPWDNLKPVSMYDFRYKPKVASDIPASNLRLIPVFRLYICIYTMPF